MSSLLLSALATGSSGQRAPYVDDVFSVYTYTGNGSTQTINNGIDLAGKGGLVWIKGRSGAQPTYSHMLGDSVRPAGYVLNTNSTNESYYNPGTIASLTQNGFSVGNSVSTNESSTKYASWTFRRAERFFDVVTFTTNSSGVFTSSLPHTLGVVPGMIIFKDINQSDNWYVWHRYNTTKALMLNSTSSVLNAEVWINVSETSLSSIRMGDLSGKANATYVAYLFAHDLSAEGIIQCGSYVGNDSSNGPVVNLGWEPQWVMIKSASISNPWYISDEMRGFTAGVADGGFATLQPNASSAEVASTQTVAKTSTGFRIVNSGTGVNGSGATYIYLAIRRPNKPPTSGTQVYNAIARTGTGAVATVTGVGFAPDLVHSQDRVQQLAGSAFYDRLRGGSAQLLTTRADAEFINGTQIKSFDMDGYTASVDTVPYPAINSTAVTYINHFFRRASGFFDVVCDTGTGVAHAIAHNLTKAPELIIRKSRSAATQWEVWHSALAATEKLVLNSNAAKATDATAWNSTLPDATQFTVGTGANVNANAATFVTYLFATLAGISKVSSYPGNGSSQLIDCGFSTGTRFFLVKATSTTGSWWVFDSARGIVSSFDPALQLNFTAAEITSADAVDPASVGIIVNQEATCSINALGVNYIYLAIS